MKGPLFPKLAIPPAPPVAPERDASAPRVVRAAGGTPVSPPDAIPARDGARIMENRAHFDSLSHRDEVPGAAGVQEVKFLIAGVDRPEPRVYFLNTSKYPFHYDFANEVLRVGIPLETFNARTYFTERREFLAGTILAHDAFRDHDHPQGLFAMEFWPTDPVSARLLILAWRLIAEAAPFAGSRIAYHPSDGNQEDIVRAATAEFGAAGVPVIFSSALFANLTYSALNIGVGFGRLRVIDAGDARPPGIADVVIFRTLPNDLTHVGGVMSEEPQTPLSHVNLRARQNDTPNAYLKTASSDPRVKPHLGAIVRYEVASEGLTVAPATVEELNAFLEARRPAEPQNPRRDLDVRAIVDLRAAGHGDLGAIGAKAANVAELGKLLGAEVAPQGYAIPFAFYDDFMTENGLYDRARAAIADPAFVAEPEARDRVLAALRKAIWRAPVSRAAHDAFATMRAAFSADLPLRCRSSTNNEDLEGFNGAGLYDSFSHRPDEGGIENTIRQVWASLWNLRAFDEREFYRIDHFAAAMAVLVYPNYDDEMANGVALTKNVYFPSFEGYYINVQLGEAQVANPDPNAIPEELLVMADPNASAEESFETIYIRRSSLTDGKVLDKDQIHRLTDSLRRIQAHFRTVYRAEANPAFAMDVEFKFDRSGRLAVKQARPWVD